MQVDIARGIRICSFCLFTSSICSLLSSLALPFDTLYCSREGKEEKKKQAEETEEEEQERSESEKGHYLRYINSVLTWQVLS